MSCWLCFTDSTVQLFITWWKQRDDSLTQPQSTSDKTFAALLLLLLSFLLSAHSPLCSSQCATAHAWAQDRHPTGRWTLWILVHTILVVTRSCRDSEIFWPLRNRRQCGSRRTSEGQSESRRGESTTFQPQPVLDLIYLFILKRGKDSIFYLSIALDLSPLCRNVRQICSFCALRLLVQGLGFNLFAWFLFQCNWLAKALLISIFALFGNSGWLHLCLQLEEENKLVKEEITQVANRPHRHIGELLKLLLAHLVQSNQTLKTMAVSLNQLVELKAWCYQPCWSCARWGWPGMAVCDTLCLSLSRKTEMRIFTLSFG